MILILSRYFLLLGVTISNTIRRISSLEDDKKYLIKYIKNNLSDVAHHEHFGCTLHNTSLIGVKHSSVTISQLILYCSWLHRMNILESKIGGVFSQNWIVLMAYCNTWRCRLYWTFSMLSLLMSQCGDKSIIHRINSV